MNLRKQFNCILIEYGVRVPEDMRVSALADIEDAMRAGTPFAVAVWQPPAIEREIRAQIKAFGSTLDNQDVIWNAYSLMRVYGCSAQDAVAETLGFV